MNVFNPDNIEPGDLVTLKPLHGDESTELMKVETVSGKHGNKVFCQALGREYYATCFRLVRKHGGSK